MTVRACDLERVRHIVVPGGLVHLSGRVKGWHDRSMPSAAAVAPPTRVQQCNPSPPLSRPRTILASQCCASDPFNTHPSLPIRPRIPTPAQGVSNICAETDDLAAEA